MQNRRTGRLAEADTCHNFMGLKPKNSMGENRALTASVNSLPDGFEICNLDDIPDGGVRVIDRLIESRKVSLLVLRSGQVCYGYLNKCPHFGMPLSETDRHLIFEPDRWLKCNVHYARFRWQDGYCEAGDCEGDSLTAVPLMNVAGKIVTGTPR